MPISSRCLWQFDYLIDRVQRLFPAIDQRRDEQ